MKNACRMAFVEASTDKQKAIVDADKQAWINASTQEKESRMNKS